jgi:hypothetical protein
MLVRRRLQCHPGGGQVLRLLASVPGRHPERGRECRLQRRATRAPNSTTARASNSPRHHCAAARSAPTPHSATPHSPPCHSPATHARWYGPHLVSCGQAGTVPCLCPVVSSPWRPCQYSAWPGSRTYSGPGRGAMRPRIESALATGLRFKREGRVGRPARFRVHLG